MLGKVPEMPVVGDGEYTSRATTAKRVVSKEQASLSTETAFPSKRKNGKEDGRAGMHITQSILPSGFPWKTISTTPSDPSHSIGLDQLRSRLRPTRILVDRFPPKPPPTFVTREAQFPAAAIRNHTTLRSPSKRQMTYLARYECTFPRDPSSRLSALNFESSESLL